MSIVYVLHASFLGVCECLQSRVPKFGCRMRLRFYILVSVHGEDLKYIKSIWWMPWRIEAMKDVLRCDKRWGAAKKL